MKYKKILITGGAGFVGSNIALRLKSNFPKALIISFDNLVRKGSDLNIPRLRDEGVKFLKGDVRNVSDLESAGDIDLIIECSAECSVLAGYHSPAKYLIETNLMGAVNCLELAKNKKSDIVFLSTSRVYPIEALRNLPLIEKESRLVLDPEAAVKGVLNQAISEDFSLNGSRSFYGASKLAAELLVGEYAQGYGIGAIINRCGVIAGPWQMGKVDQGVLALWVAAHIWGKDLSYIGFGGKQVRDILHIDDLCALIELQLGDIGLYNNKVFNVGGGIANSISLRELTALCQEITGKTIAISTLNSLRDADIPYYVSDYSRLTEVSGWRPKKDVRMTVKDVYDWIIDNKDMLTSVFL